MFDDDQNWVLNTPCSLRLSEERKSVRLQYMEDKIAVESLVLQGRFIIAVHRAFVSGCEGPSIAELRSVACRVAS